MVHISSIGQLDARAIAAAVVGTHCNQPTDFGHATASYAASALAGP